MSKKISAGAQAILLDVKVGVGAFMHSVDEAKQLAQAMVDIGQRVGRRTLALISDMNQPLGFAIGNALEVREAIDTLHGAGPDDFTDHCLEVAGFLLVLAGKANQLEDAKAMVKESIDSGSAWEKFSALVEAQGGDLTVIENPENLPSATYIEAVPSPRSGYVEAVHARKIGLSAMQLGAGREKKGDRIDYAVGIEVHHKVGDRVQQGEPLFTLHANHESKLQAAKKQVLEAHQISDQRIAPLPLFYDVIEPEWEQ
jgi:pyrimidine-nucleoside phosphorylase